jgi:5-methylcytosine-specific restriction endonuclease McrA
MPGTIHRHCTYQGCSTLVRAGRCAVHQGKRTSYGRPHRRASQHVIDNATTCARCGKPFTADNPPTRGHRIAIADGGTHDPANYQAEHDHCNKSAGATEANGNRR